MARRMRLPSWVEDAPKKSKPVEPLRYRISPNEKKLDELDALEAELERMNGDICLEEYDYLKAMLDSKRERLAKARERDLGVQKEKSRPVVRQRVSPSRRKETVGSWLISSNGVKWAVACFISALVIF